MSEWMQECESCAGEGCEDCNGFGYVPHAHQPADEDVILDAGSDEHLALLRAADAQTLANFYRQAQMWAHLKKAYMEWGFTEYMAEQMVMMQFQYEMEFVEGEE